MIVPVTKKDIDYELAVNNYNPNHVWITREKFQDILGYLRSKEEKYIQEVIKSLSLIHNIDKSDLFWKKSLSLGFRRFIHITYDAYCYHKDRDFSKYDIRIMDKSQYITPLNFEEFRDTFTNDKIGDNQFFSQYIECFSPDINNIIRYKNQDTKIKKQKPKTSILDILKRKVKNITIDKIINHLLVFIFKPNPPALLILNSYFKPSYLKVLLFKSFGKIKIINFPKRITDNNFKITLRKKFLHNFQNIDDDFDKFFYNTLYYNFPSFFIENFQSNYNLYGNYLSKFKNLNYIVCEDWISSTENSFILAIAKEENKIKHVYNEHNALFHHVLGSSVSLEKQLTDIYYTIGWDDNSNVTKGASLYDFDHKRSYQKKYEILYISSTTFLKKSEWNAHYSFSQDAGQLHIRFAYDFLDNLSSNNLSKVIYRPYPFHYSWRGFGKEQILRQLLKKVLLIDNFEFTSKIMMKKSKLVIIDYISTGYLESLIMNIPTIIFWDKETYFLNDDNLDFFDKLIECGICQTSPEDAATFVNDLVDNNKIEQWWNSEKTQKARKYFLDQNIGDPQDAIDFYLSLVKK